MCTVYIIWFVSSVFHAFAIGIWRKLGCACTWQIQFTEICPTVTKPTALSDELLNCLSGFLESGLPHPGGTARSRQMPTCTHGSCGAGWRGMAHPDGHSVPRCAACCRRPLLIGGGITPRHHWRSKRGASWPLQALLYFCLKTVGVWMRMGWLPFMHVHSLLLCSFNPRLVWCC